jgi:hypothetical protein
MRIDFDMLSDVATAVYAGDLEGATAALDLMRASAGEGLAGLLIRAKQVSRPLPPLEPMAEAIPLPNYTSDARALFGGPDPLSPRIMRR